MIYLASPYTNPDKEIEEWNYFQVARACASLADRGIDVYSPIAHWHPIAKQFHMRTDYLYYKNLNESMIRRCDITAVLTIEGWEQSKGIAHEIEFSHGLLKPVVLVSPDDIFVLDFERIMSVRD